MRARLAVALLLLALAAPARAAIRFREASQEWGLVFRHHHAGSGERYLPETMVGGVVIFDFDGDGDQDVFFVDAGVLPGYRGEAPRSRLFRNDGPGAGGARFVDVSERSGIAVHDYGAGAIAGDVDGDGDLDLYVTTFGRNQLFRNEGTAAGGPFFTDVTAAAGVGDPRWSMSAAFADVDLDFDLDLYVADYVDFDLEHNEYCGRREEGLRGYCNPVVYEGVPDRFYRNDGPGPGGVPAFVDATDAAGLGAVRSRGLGVVFADLDEDGRPDLYVANDMHPNSLYFNRGPGAGGGVVFEDLSLLSGAAYGPSGEAEAGMGVDAADLDGDGRDEIVVTNFELETNALYRNLGDGLFRDDRFPLGLAEPSLLKLTFGVAFADFDQDGDLDLAVANGHLNDNAAALGSQTPYRQPNQVFEMRGGRFVEVADAGLAAVVRASRGLAVGDLDGDGDPDLVIVDSNEEAEVWENVSTGGGFLAVDLARSSGDAFAVGARLSLDLASAPGGRAWREVRTGASYLSQNALTVHFGTGETRLGRLRVRWPGGGATAVDGLPAGRRVRLRAPAPPAGAVPSPPPG